MPRYPISPKVRWQVLARDGFRCRYCGAKGGDVVLVVDHAIAVARGGWNNADNLITACEPCNQGKSDSDGPTLHVVRDLQAIARNARGWLASEWDDASGDVIDWQPNDDIYLRVAQTFVDWSTAREFIRDYAETARDSGRKPEDVLQEMWDYLDNEAEWE